MGICGALRAEKGLAYSFSAEIIEHLRADALLTCTRVPKDATELGLRLFTQVLAGMSARAPSQAELQPAKAVLRARIVGRHDDVRRSMNTWLDELMSGARPPVEEDLAALDAVSAEAVLQLAASLDLANGMRFVMLGDEATAKRAANARTLSPLVKVGGSL